jgi:stearoyl-CoA 9-desaturase NADPH oxidoreductase
MDSTLEHHAIVSKPSLPRWDLLDLTHARRPLNALLRNKVVGALANPRKIDDYLGLVDRAWSVHDVRARIAGLERETSDATSLYLRPNENWRGFRAGQFVQISTTIAGIHVTRCFSISSAPEDRGHLRLTMKAVPDGRMSGWARADARVGDVVELSQAMGEFVLPNPLPARLLFVSGGSGVTPILSMLRHLAATGYEGAVSCLHYARGEVIGGEELASLTKRLGARVATIPTTGASRDGRRLHLGPSLLEAFEPRWADAEAFVCGPAAMNAAAAVIWRAQGVAERFHCEHFAPPPMAAVVRGDGAACRLVFARSKLEKQGEGGVALLEQAERAGLRPKHGCRMGICRTCTCRKLTGTVRNTLTGEISSRDDEPIQLCVSAPLSDVSLDL